MEKRVVVCETCRVCGTAGGDIGKRALLLFADSAAMNRGPHSKTPLASGYVWVLKEPGCCATLEARGEI